ncbi:CHAT domain-containing protein [Sphingopyxis sp.]|uniref:CHAT domain-containing protein n=1 Tax=Sphingopyxis sp. TaxID=1908224 RepID=UPI003D6D483F
MLTAVSLLATAAQAQVLPDPEKYEGATDADYAAAFATEIDAILYKERPDDARDSLRTMASYRIARARDLLTAAPDARPLMQHPLTTRLFDAINAYRLTSPADRAAMNALLDQMVARCGSLVETDAICRRAIALSAWMLDTQGEDAEALPLIERALAGKDVAKLVDPAEGQLWGQRAAVLAELGRTEEAVNLWRKLATSPLARSGESQQRWINDGLADALAKAGRPEEALPLRRVLAEAPTKGFFRTYNIVQWAKALAAADQPAEAEQLLLVEYDRLADLNHYSELDNLSDVTAALVDLHLAKGDVAAAQKEIDLFNEQFAHHYADGSGINKAALVNPNSRSFRFARAKVQLAQGDAPAAAVDLESVVREYASLLRLGGIGDQAFDLLDTLPAEAVKVDRAKLRRELQGELTGARLAALWRQAETDLFAGRLTEALAAYERAAPLAATQIADDAETRARILRGRGLARFAAGNRAGALADWQEEKRIDDIRFKVLEVDGADCSVNIWLAQAADTRSLIGQRPPGCPTTGENESDVVFGQQYAFWLLMGLARRNDPTLMPEVLPWLRSMVDSLRASERAFVQPEFSDGRGAGYSFVDRLDSPQAALADALWAAESGRPSAEATTEAFDLLQDAALTGTAEAVSINAGRAAAAGRAPALGKLAEEYQQLVASLPSGRDMTPQMQTPPPPAPVVPVRPFRFDDESDAAFAKREAEFVAAEAAYKLELARYEDNVRFARERADELRRAMALQAEKDAAALAVRKKRLTQVVGELQAEFPDYFALIRPRPLGLAELQALLADDEAALLLVPTDGGTHAIAVTRDAIRWHRSGWNNKRLDRAVTRLRWDLGADVNVPEEVAAVWESRGGGGYAFDRTLAFQLYRELIEPLGPTLAGKKFVLATTAGALSALPLGVLVSEAPQGDDGDPDALRATKWLADAFALTHLPSLQTLQFERAKAADPARSADAAPRFAGFGDPVLLGPPRARRGGRDARRAMGATANAVSGEQVDQLRSLSRLPGTATELEALRASLNAPASTLRMAERATEPSVFAADLSQISILSFATHGLLPGDVEGLGEAALVFTPPVTPGPDDDGLLTASEVAGLRLNADWVILSACNTATGEAGKATGLGGLSRAFLFAGARNLLASHWPVRDDVASVVTVKAIAAAREVPGRTRAEALQIAMRAIRDDRRGDDFFQSWAHPNAWAAFELIGDIGR